MTEFKDVLDETGHVIDGLRRSTLPHYRDRVETARHDESRQVSVQIGWQTNYATEIEVQLRKARPIDLFLAVKSWIDSHHRPHEDRQGKYHVQHRGRNIGREARSVNPIPCSIEDFIAGVERRSQNKLISLSTQSIVGTGTTDSPQFWVSTYSHPESEFRHRTWKTTIGLTQHKPGSFVMTILNQHKLSADYHGEVESVPHLSVPRVVRNIIQRSENEKDSWMIRSGKTRLTSYPQSIGQAELPRLASAIEDSERKQLLVVLSRNTEEPDFPYGVDPGKLARSLTGIGIVMLLEEETVAYDPQLEALAGYQYVKPGTLPFGGWGQIYWPSRSEEFPPKSFRLSKDDLLDGIEDDNIQITALRSAVNLSADSTSLVIRTPDDIARIGQDLEFARSRENFRTQLQEAEKVRVAELESKAAEVDGSLDSAVVAELKERFGRHEAQMIEYIDSLELKLSRATSANNDMAGTIRQLRDQLEIARCELGAEASRAKAYREVLEQRGSQRSQIELNEPQTIVEALTYIQQRYSGNVVVLPDAQNGAAEMLDSGWPVRDATQTRAIGLLKKIADDYWKMRFEDKILDAQLIRDRLGFEVAFTESSQVKNDSRLSAHRQVEYKGETIYAFAHFKMGTTPNNQIRIHFYIDEQDRKIVICKIADHLPIGSSRPDGKKH